MPDLVAVRVVGPRDGEAGALDRMDRRRGRRASSARSAALPGVARPRDTSTRLLCRAVERHSSRRAGVARHEPLWIVELAPRQGVPHRGAAAMPRGPRRRGVRAPARAPGHDRRGRRQASACRQRCRTRHLRRGRQRRGRQRPLHPNQLLRPEPRAARRRASPGLDREVRMAAKARPRRRRRRAGPPRWRCPRSVARARGRGSSRWPARRGGR